MLTRTRKAMADKDQGFTLVELLVVIIVIGVLAAIAIPSFFSQRKKAVDASLKSDLHNVAVLVETWAVHHPGAALPGWEDSDPQIGPVLTGIKPSVGNRIVLGPSSVPGAWCLFANNPNASEAIDDDHSMLWKSRLGGLDPAIGPVSSFCA